MTDSSFTQFDACRVSSIFKQKCWQCQLSFPKSTEAGVTFRLELKIANAYVSQRKEEEEAKVAL